MGVGPVSLVSQLVSQSVPACSKVCFPNKLPANFTVVDPYPNCPTKCPANQTLNWNPIYQNQASSIALMVGVIMTVLAPILGWCMNFIPSPIIMGFTSGGGIIIAMGQLKNIQGYSIRTDVLQNGVYDFFAYINQTRRTTAIMGWLAIGFLFFLRKLGQGRILWWKVRAIPEWVKQATLLPWAFGLVVLYTGISAQMNLAGTQGVAVTGAIPPGLPPIKVPYDLSDGIPNLISVTIIITIVGYLESIAVETKFAHQFKYQINPTQESFAQGWGNIFGGLTGAYPAVGSFSRSATNAAYGSKSPMCNFVAAMVIMVCLLVLTPYLYDMPQNVLAAIVIVAALSLVEIPEFIYLFRTNKFEFLVIMLTALLVLFSSLQNGIYASVSLCGFVVLFQVRTPRTARTARSEASARRPASLIFLSRWARRLTACRLPPLAMAGDAAQGDDGVGQPHLHLPARLDVADPEQRD